MSTSKTRKKLKRDYNRAQNSVNRSFSPITNIFSHWIERLKLGATKPQVFAYQLVGRRTNRFLSLFKDLDVNLKKSGMKVNFKAYVSTVIGLVCLGFNGDGLLCISKLSGRYPEERLGG
jgi:hypothetical protein